jgi:hypothetical protein
MCCGSGGRAAPLNIPANPGRTEGAGRDADGGAYLSAGSCWLSDVVILLRRSDCSPGSPGVSQGGARLLVNGFLDRGQDVLHLRLCRQLNFAHHTASP